MNYRKITGLDSTDVQGNPNVYTVGQGHPKCTEIQEAPPCGEGDRWSWWIKFDDGRCIREFGAIRVYFAAPPEHKFVGRKVTTKYGQREWIAVPDGHDSEGEPIYMGDGGNHHRESDMRAVEEGGK